MKVFLVRFWVVLCLAVCVGTPRFAHAQGNKLNKSFGTIGDSELRGCVTIWYWSQLGLTPIEDWHYNERRGHELSSLLVYLSNGRLRTRANTAWGGTTARDWATNGRLSAPGQSTPNTVHADQSRSLRWKPGLVFICVGMNDATIVPGATLSPKDHTAYLGQVRTVKFLTVWL